jgi:EAL domain-containing protein (putative c-di-GMP-specific phosphodiesterase class I)
VVRVDENRSVKMSTSAGVLVHVDGYEPVDPGDILSKCISAFRVAQTGGRGHVIYYDEELTLQKQKNARVQQKLSDALANEEFVPYYQPKVNVHTGRIVGGEALCRWFHNGKVMQPAEFIPALEQNNDICKLDLFMLEQVCRNQRAWLDGGEGRKLVPMSINFSRKHIKNPELPNAIERIMDKYNIPHDAIEIEFTETTTEIEFNALKQIVTDLRGKGIYASVDDFGIGLSSLSILKDIPWKTIKIDKSFVPEETDEYDGAKCVMFKDVVSMIKNLGFTCIAEGVETEFQINFLREVGCDYVQGYYYDKPLSKEDFEARLVTKLYDKV